MHQFLYMDITTEASGFPFEKIWKWQGHPEFAHSYGNWLMTGSWPMKKDAIGSWWTMIYAPRDMMISHPETRSHFRGCKEVANMWSKFISKDPWSWFFSVGFDQWLWTNLFSTHRSDPEAFLASWLDKQTLYILDSLSRKLSMLKLASMLRKLRGFLPQNV